MSKINFRVDSKENFDKANTKLSKGEPALSNTFPYEFRISTSGETSWKDSISLKPVLKYSPAKVGDDDCTPGTITYDDKYLYIKTDTGWNKVELSAVKEKSQFSSLLSDDAGSFAPVDLPNSNLSISEKLAKDNAAIGILNNQTVTDDSSFRLTMEEFRDYNYCLEDTGRASGISTTVNGIPSLSVPIVKSSGEDFEKYIEYNLTGFDCPAGEDFILQTCTGYGTVNGDFQYFGVENHSTYPSGTTTIIVPFSGLPVNSDNLVGTRIVYTSHSGIVSSSGVDPSLQFPPHPFTDLMSSAFDGSKGIFQGGSFPIQTVYQKRNTPVSWSNILPNNYSGKVSWTHPDNDTDLFLNFVDPSYGGNFEVYKRLNTIPSNFSFQSDVKPNYFPFSKMSVSDVLPDIRQVECGINNQFYAVTEQNELLGWGYLRGLSFNEVAGGVDMTMPFGGFGLAVGPTYIQIGEGLAIDKVCAGNNFAVALTTEGQVWWWGFMGTNTSRWASSQSPTPLFFDGVITDISLYNDTVVFCDEGGDMWYFGNQFSTTFFDFSLGTQQWWNHDPRIPRRIPIFPDGGVQKVSVGADHLLFRSGTLLFGMGDVNNINGSFGSSHLAGGATTSANVVLISNDVSTDDYSFAAGFNSTVFINSDGAYVQGVLAGSNRNEYIDDNEPKRCFASKVDQEFKSTICVVGEKTGNNTDADGPYRIGTTKVMGRNCGFYNYLNGSLEDYIQNSSFRFSSNGVMAGVDSATQDLYDLNHPSNLTFYRPLNLGWIDCGEETVIDNSNPFNPIESITSRKSVAMNEHNFLCTGKFVRYQKFDYNNNDFSFVRRENPLPTATYSMDDYNSGPNSNSTEINFSYNSQLSSSMIQTISARGFGMVQTEYGL